MQNDKLGTLKIYAGNGGADASLLSEIDINKGFLTSDIIQGDSDSCGTVAFAHIFSASGDYSADYHKNDSGDWILTSERKSLRLRMRILFRKLKQLFKR